MIAAVGGCRKVIHLGVPQRVHGCGASVAAAGGGAGGQHKWAPDPCKSHPHNLDALLAKCPALKKLIREECVSGNLDATPLFELAHSLLSQPARGSAATRSTHLTELFNEYGTIADVEDLASILLCAGAADASTGLVDLVVQFCEEHKIDPAEAKSTAFHLAGHLQLGWEHVRDASSFKPYRVLSAASRLTNFTYAVDDLDEQGAGASLAVPICQQDEGKRVSECLVLGSLRMDAWHTAGAACLSGIIPTVVRLNRTYRLFSWSRVPSSSLAPPVLLRRQELQRRYVTLAQLDKLLKVLGRPLKPSIAFLLEAAGLAVTELLHGASMEVPPSALQLLIESRMLAAGIADAHDLAAEAKGEAAAAAAGVEQLKHKASIATMNAALAAADAMQANRAAAQANRGVEQVSGQVALLGMLNEQASSAAAGAQAAAAAVQQEQKEQRKEIAAARKDAAAAQQRAEAAEEKTAAETAALATKVEEQGRTIVRLAQQLARLEADKENGARAAHQTPAASPLGQACGLPTPQLQKRLFSDAAEEEDEAAADGNSLQGGNSL